MDAIVAEHGTFTIDQMLEALATAGSTLPVAAMQWSLDNWDIAAPRFLAMLDAVADGEAPSRPSGDVLFFALHMMGEKREAAAFPPLCRVMLDRDRLESIIGDGITTTLCGIIINTFDGDTAALQAVIEAPDADQFVRSAALDALTYLVHAGAIPTLDMRNYLLHLLTTMRPRQDNFTWSAWALAIARLGYSELTPQVEYAFRHRFVDPMCMGLDDFKADLQRFTDGAELAKDFIRDGLTPLNDAIGTLSTWYGFSEQAREDERRAAERAKHTPSPLPALPEPTADPFRHVGRNDPCPCGSGKKFKKCCLQ